MQPRAFTHAEHEHMEEDNNDDALIEQNEAGGNDNNGTQLQHEEEEEREDGEEDAPAATEKGALEESIARTIDAPVQELLQSVLCPAAMSIQQEIDNLMQEVETTEGAANTEKAAIDAELFRIQHLVRSFQEHMSRLMNFGI